jgi:hypothetical protein
VVAVPALLNGLSPAARCQSWTVTPAAAVCVSAPETVTCAPAVIGSGEAEIERLGGQANSTGPGQHRIGGCAIGGPQHVVTEAVTGHTITLVAFCRPDAEATVPPPTASAAKNSTNRRRIGLLIYPLTTDLMSGACRLSDRRH